ncbi:MAG: SGNH/GDSL hydrolase family protein, partial [bacterium]
MEIKDFSKNKLARVKDFYPSSYKIDRSDLKILAVGDSYAVGSGLYNFNYTWAGTLEHKLLEAGYNIEVDRFASNGADFPDYLEMLSSSNIELVDPDVIVISLYENDLLLPIK